MESLIGRVEQWGAGLFLNILKPDASRTGFLQFGNLASFEMGKEGGSSEKFKSTNPLNFAATIGSLSEAGDDIVNLTVNTMHKELRAVNALGTDTVVTVAAGSAADQAIVAKHDAWVKLPHRFITSGTDVVTDSGGGTTYVNGTDYDLDLTWGRIRAKSSGAISDAEDLLVDYDHRGEAGYEISASQQAEIVAEMWLLGQDNKSKELMIIEAARTLWRPNQLVTLVTADTSRIAEVALQASIELEEGASAPYTQRIVAAAA